MAKLNRYIVRNRRSGRVFYRYGKTAANVVKRLGSSPAHRDDYEVRSSPK